jgi:hypothetical protein
MEETNMPYNNNRKIMRRTGQMKGTKFMLVLNSKVEKDLLKHAKDAHVHLQEFLRARVIPDWLYGPPIVSNRTIEKLREKGLIPQK